MTESVTVTQLASRIEGAKSERERMRALLASLHESYKSTVADRTENARHRREQELTIETADLARAILKVRLKEGSILADDAALESRTIEATIGQSIEILQNIGIRGAYLWSQVEQISIDISTAQSDYQTLLTQESYLNHEMLCEEFSAVYSLDVEDELDGLLDHHREEDDSDDIDDEDEEDGEPHFDAGPCEAEDCCRTQTEVMLSDIASAAEDNPSVDEDVIPADESVVDLVEDKA